MRIVQLTLLVAVAILSLALGQEQQYYQDDYANDNLYHDYAARQQDKNGGGQVGMPWAKLMVATTFGWFAGAKFHAGKLQKKLNGKHKREQKDLYSQYYNDVYTLKEQNGQLIQALEQMGVPVR